MTSPDPLDPLLPYLYDGYTATWTKEQWAILRELADHCNPGGHAERAVTKMLCAVGGPIGHTLANIFLDLAGQPVSPNAEMIDPEIQVPLSGRRAPDIGVREATADRLLLVAEGKRDAKINGDLGYCPYDSAEYSSQVICYAHECWTLPGTLQHAGFLWLHPHGTALWNGGWHEGYLDNPRYAEVDPERLRRWIDTELAATRQWRTATWEDLVARVHDPQDPAAQTITKIVTTWLGPVTG